MSEELRLAFEQMSERGRKAGASAVVSRALTESMRLPQARRRYSFVTVGALVATVAVVAASAALVRSRVPEIERVNVGSSLASGTGSPGVMTLLVVGTDGARRADAVMLVRVDRSSGALSVLSLPRDLHLPTADSGPHARLATMSGSALIDTVRSVTGIPVQHFVEFDFTGFKKVVDAAGGVGLHVPARMRDRLSGLDLHPGCNRLDGDAALAYVQARHVETQDGPGGRFIADPTGDLGRIARQQALLILALDQITRTRDLVQMDRIADAVADSVRLDEAFSFRDAMDFAKAWIEKKGSRQLLTYPATPASLDNGALVLRPDEVQAATAIASFNNPPEAPLDATGQVGCE